MVRLHIVWDVANAKPVTAPAIYGWAQQRADALEQRFKRAFLVLEQPDVAIRL